MPSDHQSPAVDRPTQNGDPPPHRLPRLHKIVFPTPQLKPPIDPALLQHIGYLILVAGKARRAQQNRYAQRQHACGQQYNHQPGAPQANLPSFVHKPASA